MATLTIAREANPALTLPVFLAATYAAHQGVKTKIDTVFENTDRVDSNKNATVLVTEAGEKLVGAEILRFLLGLLDRVQGRPSQTLIEEWLDRLHAFTVLDFKTLETPVQKLEAHLTLCSYIVGHSFSLADVVIWGALRGNRVIVGLRRNNQNVNRWFNYIEAMYPWLAETVAHFNQQTKTEDGAKGANYNIGLKNTEHGIICRFPPEPSGYLHIGHAKAALLNEYFAHEYGDTRGVLICRFDDTNPSKESQEFQDSILYDLSLLGVVPDRISHSSDYFQQMYDACVELIKSGKAYADNTVKEVMQDQRKNGVASTCRDMSIEETLKKFEEMKSGSAEGMQWCIRAKISVDDVNKALRDPVIYRCNHQPHHRTGTTWKVYPTYDFCAPYLDSVEQVTHALRTNEYRDRNPQYHWMQFHSNGLLKEEAYYHLRGIRRRGCTIPALREFILKQGPSQNIVNMDWTQFWAVNKKYIDPIAARYTAIPKQDAVTAYIEGIEETSSAQKPKHAKNSDLGTKEVLMGKEILIGQEDAQSFKDNELITLMNWGNTVVVTKTVDPQTGKIATLHLKLDLESDPKKTEKKITWLAKEPRNMVPWSYMPLTI